MPNGRRRRTRQRGAHGGGAHGGTERGGNALRGEEEYGNLWQQQLQQEYGARDALALSGTQGEEGNVWLAQLRQEYGYGQHTGNQAVGEPGGGGAAGAAGMASLGVGVGVGGRRRYRIKSTHGKTTGKAARQESAYPLTARQQAAARQQVAARQQLVREHRHASRGGGSKGQEAVHEARDKSARGDGHAWQPDTQATATVQQAAVQQPAALQYGQPTRCPQSSTARLSTRVRRITSGAAAAIARAECLVGGSAEEVRGGASVSGATVGVATVGGATVGMTVGTRVGGGIAGASPQHRLDGASATDEYYSEGDEGGTTLGSVTVPSATPNALGGVTAVGIPVAILRPWRSTLLTSHLEGR